MTQPLSSAAACLFEEEEEEEKDGDTTTHATALDAAVEEAWERVGEEVDGEDGEQQEEGKGEGADSSAPKRYLRLHRPWHPQKPTVRVESRPDGPSSTTEKKLAMFLRAHKAYVAKNMVGHNTLKIEGQEFTVIVVNGLSMHTRLTTPGYSLRILGSFATVQDAERYIAAVYAETQMIRPTEECAIIPNYVEHQLRNTRRPDRHAQLHFEQSDENTAYLQERVHMQARTKEEKDRANAMAARTRHKLDPPKRPYNIPAEARRIRDRQVALDRTRLRFIALTEYGAARDPTDTFLNAVRQVPDSAVPQES